jgi:hypothetical protein
MDAELGTLLSGGAVPKVVSEHVVLRELETDTNAVWNLLLMSGYLTARGVELREGELHAEVAIPNEEVKYVFRTSVRSWVQAGLGGADRVEALLRAMLRGEEETFGKLLTKLVANTFSYHDTGGREPERVYQAFLLGLLVQLEGTHRVRSNRESGYGRYDVAVIPRQVGQPGVVLELKEVDDGAGETVEQALENALAQVRDRGYGAELREAGAEPAHAYGIAFDGKRVWVRREGA